MDEKESSAKDDADGFDRKVYGGYEILRPIGKGKFAIVYRAKRLSDGETGACVPFVLFAQHVTFYFLLYTLVATSGAETHFCRYDGRKGARKVPQRSAAASVIGPPKHHPIPRLLYR